MFGFFKKRSKKPLYTFIFIFSLGIIFSGLFSWGLEATNTTEFCTSCHSMQTNLTELKTTPHWKNSSGIHAGCADCHVPKAFLPKMYAKIMAAKDVWHTILGTIDTPEKYEKHRWQMANAVWDKMKASDSRECRSCHSFEHMNFDEQGKTASKKHPVAMEKGKTCIECHKGVAHEEPDEPEKIATK